MLPGERRQWIYMKLFPAILAASAALLLAACSDSPTTAKKKAPEAPSAPITGRQAFQYTFGSARIWAADSQPVSIRSADLAEVKSESGKAGAWEVVFVSESMGRARGYTWSAVETEGWHKGVFAGQQGQWNAGGPQKPFSPALIKIDTPEALEIAVKASADYLNKPGKRPPVSFALEDSGRFPIPAWRVLWGGTVSSAEYFVTIDANTGKLLGKN
jgi:hypothetical protein